MSRSLFNSLFIFTILPFIFVTSSRLIPSSKYSIECGHNGVSCQNGGVCEGTVPVGGDLNSRCRCAENFDGPLCQYRQCPANPCVNGYCEYFGNNKLQCHCHPGYEGEFCTFETQHPCRHLDCQNNGECRTVGSVGMCLCTPGYIGMYCEQVDPCENVTCSDRGSCRSGVCTCQPGFTGDNCEHEVDECEHNKCFPGSKCIDKMNAYECECQPDRVGPLCEMQNACVVDNKCVNGECAAFENGSSACFCNSGFVGEHCDVDVNECEVSNACGDNGKCNNTYGSYTCECLLGFEGKPCIRTVEGSVVENWYLICSMFAVLTIVLVTFVICIFSPRNTGSYDVYAEVPQIGLPKITA